MADKNTVVLMSVKVYQKDDNVPMIMLWQTCTQPYYSHKAK